MSSSSSNDGSSRRPLQTSGARGSAEASSTPTGLLHDAARDRRPDPARRFFRAGISRPEQRRAREAHQLGREREDRRERDRGGDRERGPRVAEQTEARERHQRARHRHRTRAGRDHRGRAAQRARRPDRGAPVARRFAHAREQEQAVVGADSEQQRHEEAARLIGDGQTELRRERDGAERDPERDAERHQRDERGERRAVDREQRDRDERDRGEPERRPPSSIAAR